MKKTYYEKALEAAVKKSELTKPQDINIAFRRGADFGYKYRQAEVDELKKELEQNYKIYFADMRINNEIIKKLEATQEKLVKALTSVITAFKQTSSLTTTQQHQFLSDIEPILDATKGE